MKGFGSDNHSGVHPAFLEAIARVNVEHVAAYGVDDFSKKAEAAIQKMFGGNARSLFVFNGTGANVIALRAMMTPWQSCLCSDVAHINVDEGGAPERLAGKLLALPTTDGKLKLEQLKQALIRRGDQHYSQIKVVSLTQPTELGTCYTVEEIAEITKWAHAEGLLVHVDGSRLSNAVNFLKTTFAEMLTRTGVDVVSFGGTKNGMLFGEAVVVLNPTLAEQLPYIRKQCMQLPSKTRFLGAQFERYLETGLWREIAQHSHAMALLLRREAAAIPGVTVTQATESNAVFARIPQSWVKQLREKHFFYVWDEKTFECRWMTSWDTTEKDVLEFAASLRHLSGTKTT